MLKPSSAMARYFGAPFHGYEGDSAAASASGDGALRLNPVDPLADIAANPYELAAMHDGRLR